MLRRIFRRTAALALPVTLAICLPPLAVIALNLHAESTVVRTQTGDASRDAIASKTSLSGKTTESRDSRFSERGVVTSTN